MNKRAPKQLNKYEHTLKQAIEDLIAKHEVNFSVFIDILRDDLPEDKTSKEYKVKYRAEYIKLLRASFSVDEVIKMLKVLGYKLEFKTDKTEIFANSEILQNTRIKYIDLMSVCELLDIKVTWQKEPIEHLQKKAKK